MRPLALLTQLLADPALLGTQGRFDVGPGHPAWRPHRQAFDTDHHADAASSGTLHGIRHHCLAQHDFTLGLRVPELRHRELLTHSAGRPRRHRILGPVMGLTVTPQTQLSGVTGGQLISPVCVDTGLSSP